MVLHIILWYKFYVRRIDGLTKTSKLQLETQPTITAIALPSHSRQDQFVQPPLNFVLARNRGCGEGRCLFSAAKSTAASAPSKTIEDRVMARLLSMILLQSGWPGCCL